MKHNELVKLVTVSILAIAFGLTANVYLHEAGHYIVADQLGLDPEAHFENPVEIDYRERAFSVEPAAAYVSYYSYDAYLSKDDALIAIAGPLVNGFLMVFFGGLFLAMPKNPRYRYRNNAVLILFLVSLFSMLINLVPISPSDGWLLYEYVISL